MNQRKRVLIVGGVAGGAAAAARARRLSEDADIIMFERGEHISFANCGLPYHIGEVIEKRESLLVQTAEGMKSRYRIDVRVKTEVLRIDRQQKQVIVRDFASGNESAEPYDALILSPGAAPVRPPIEGADRPQVMTLRNIADTLWPRRGTRWARARFAFFGLARTCAGRTGMRTTPNSQPMVTRPSNLSSRCTAKTTSTGTASSATRQNSSATSVISIAA